MATVGQDLFTEAVDTALASHTPDTGTGWTVESASFTVIAATDKVQQTTTTILGAREGTDIGSDIMDVSLTCNTGVALTRRGGPCGRYSSADHANRYEGALQGDGTAVDLDLLKEVAGTRTSLGSFNSNYAAQTVVVLKLEIRTAAKKLYADTVERISSTDDSLTGLNFAGLVMQVSSGGSDRADDFLSESVAGGTPETVTGIYALMTMGMGLALGGLAILLRSISTFFSFGEKEAA